MSGGTWWSQGMSLAITVVVVSWMMRVMVAAGRAQAARGADGVPELRYPRWYAWLGVAVALIGTVMVALAGLQSLIDGVKAALPEVQWAEALRALEEYRTRQGA